MIAAPPNFPAFGRQNTNRGGQSKTYETGGNLLRSGSLSNPFAR